MKKFLKILALTITILMVSIPVFASESLITSSYFDSLYDTSYANGLTNNTIRVQLNGEYVDFTDANGKKVEPQIINDRTMVPIRKIFEVLGADVEWIPETRSIKSNANGLEIGLQINNKIATVKDTNGVTKEIQLDSAPTIVNDRTLVPVRFIAESLDKKVGWDSYNRMVVIIDSSIIENTLKEKTPNFYEFLTLKSEKMTSAEMSLELDGKLKMENETLNVDGEMDMQLSEKAIAFQIDIELDGSKNLMQEIEAEKLDKISFDFILDMEKFVMYAKSPLIENSNNKWIKYESDYSEEEIKEVKEKLNKYLEEQKMSMLDVIEEILVPSEGLTNTSYSELEAILQIVSLVMNDNNFKVSGTKDKTYSFKFDLKDLANALGFTGSLEEIEDEAIFGISLDVKMKDGIAKESNFYLLFGEKIDNEEESIELTLKSTIESYNEPVNITMPSGKNVLDGNKMQEEEMSHVASQAAFSGFVSEMGDLQDAVKSEMLYAKGSENIRGNNRTDAQLYNFVARGGYEVLTADDDGDAKWLIQTNAKDIPCTKIEVAYAEDSLGFNLPIRYVKTYKSEKEKLEYFVTPKGKVFCWPPYIYDGKSYVNYNTIVKDENGKELGIEATKNTYAFIYFSDIKELVVVSNEANKTSLICEKYTGNIGNVGVWYQNAGKISGIDFNSYDNWSTSQNYNIKDVEVNFDITIEGTSNTFIPKPESSLKEKKLVSNFNEFKMEMDDLQDAVKAAMLTAKGEESIRGNNRTDAQLYNFVARGGYNVLFETDEGLAKWLIQVDSRDVPCTKINEKYVLGIPGEKLPNVKVNTYKTKNEQASFFITPKGNVFCWPPYEYNGKSYVNSMITVKDENGNEMTVKEATKTKQVTIMFSNGESVVVSNESNVRPTKYMRNDGNFGGIGVWYPKAGEILGIDFSKYDNTTY